MRGITMRRAWRAVVLAGFAALALAGGTGRAAEPAVAVTVRVDAPPAMLRLVNREVATLRATLGGLTPEQRVARARERIAALPRAAYEQPIGAVPMVLGEARGVQMMIGDYPLFALVEQDVDLEAKQSHEQLVRQTQARLEEVRTAWRQVNDRPLLLRGLLEAALATVLLGLLAAALYLLTGRLMVWMERWRDRVASIHAHIDWREFLARLAVASMQIVRWLLLLAIAYGWLLYVLGRFVLTAPIAGSMGGWLRERLLWLGEGALQSLPGLVTVLIVLGFTRAAVDLLGYLFDAVQRGRVRLPMVHPETVVATRRIVTLVAWALGIAAAYPYLPGSSSAAFQGLSVLFGLMITVGSAGIVTQAMSGLMLVYSRALQKGDFVDVNGVQGVVTEVASLATKIVNVRNEVITVPNAVVVSNPIRNYSKLGPTHGTLVTTKVTIGYDAPWRQVHALLIGAARATPGVRTDPAPHVYQTALSDFYVEYELFASIDRPTDRVQVLSALHAAIQDSFNEHGVQIMSPHFFSQPEQAVTVAKARWFEPPAQPPAGAS